MTCVRLAGNDLTRPGAAGEHEVLPRRPPDLDARLAAGALGPQDSDPARELLGDGLQARQPGQGADAVLAVLVLPGGVVYRRPLRPAFLPGSQAGLLCSLAIALRNAHVRLSCYRFGKVARSLKHLPPEASQV